MQEQLCVEDLTKMPFYLRAVPFLSVGGGGGGRPTGRLFEGAEFLIILSH